jgi:hypothetical protein
MLTLSLGWACGTLHILIRATMLTGTIEVDLEAVLALPVASGGAQLLCPQDALLHLGPAAGCQVPSAATPLTAQNSFQPLRSRQADWLLTMSRCRHFMS